MSADKFVGRQVRIATANQTITGTISAIDGGLLFLVNVVCNQDAIASLVVQAQEIKQLDVLPQGQPGATPIPAVASGTPAPSVASAPVSQAPVASVPATPVTTAAPAAPKAATPAAPKAVATPKAAKALKAPKNRAGSNNIKAAAARPASPAQRRQETNGTADNVREEFDFQSNLALFDKERVFNEIRQTDTVDRSERLVSHNRAAKNYSHRETVLDGSRVQSHGSVQVDELVSPYGPVPLASPLQLVQLEQQLVKEGRSLGALVELAARGISEVAMRALGVSRFDVKNHNSMPFVVVIVGASRSGMRALAAGRLLATRRVQVLACSVSEPSKLAVDQAWADQLTAFKAAGGSVVSSMSALETAVDDASAPPELIVDGLQGFEATLADLYNKSDLAVANLVVGWANRQRAPALAVDVPSGDEERINAKWIACCGYPVQAAALSGAKKYMIDLGVAPGALAAAGMRRFEKVWFGPSTVMPVENA